MEELKARIYKSTFLAVADVCSIRLVNCEASFEVRDKGMQSWHYLTCMTCLLTACLRHLRQEVKKLEYLIERG